MREEPEEQEVHFLAFDKLCQCNTHVSPTEAVTFCQKALNIKEEPRLYCEMADANIANEMFDEGELKLVENRPWEVSTESWIFLRKPSG